MGEKKPPKATTEPLFGQGRSSYLQRMTTVRKVWEPPLYALLRISPLFAPLTIVPIFRGDPLLATLQLQITLIASVLVISWNMTEGSMILYLRAKATKSAQTNGYLIATLICGALMLLMLQYFRSYVSQPVFLTALAALSFRGMSRSGWENERPAVALAAAIAGHTLLALVTFLVILPVLDWQSVTVSLAFGLAAGAVEGSWNSGVFASAPPSKLSLPLYRFAVCGGPILTVTMTLARQLAPYYLASAVALIFARRVVVRATSSSTPPASLLRGAAGVYLLFLSIISVCMVFICRSAP